MINKIVLRNSLSLWNDFLRIRVGTQKNQTEDGEKFLHLNEATQPLQTGLNRGGFFTLTVTITTNQLNINYRNDVPFTKKEVSRLLIEYW